MDTITQAVLGAAIAEAGWREKLGKGAIAFGIFCGLAPDFDVIANLAGPWAALEHHRGLTHSLFFAPIASIPLGWMGWALSKRRGNVRQWTRLAFWGLITHPLLDVFTSYGTQLLWPISKNRFALDGISIIDPLYTLPLMLALAIAFFTRKRPKIGSHLTRFMLGLTSLYLLFGVYQQEKAEVQFQRAVEAGPPLLKIRATPTFANQWIWRVIGKDKWGDLHIAYTSTLSGETWPATHLKQPESPLISKALADDRGRIFHWFSDGWLHYQLENQDGGGTRLILADQRYGSMVDPGQAMWWAEADFDANGRLLDLRNEQKKGREKVDMAKEFSTLQDYLGWNRP